MYKPILHIGITLSLPVITLAAVMSSSNYNIEFDTINSGGTENSSSLSFRMSDTVGEIGTGSVTSTNYNLFAGYRQMAETYLSMTSPTDITMTPALDGILGGTSNGSAQWTIITDSSGGYTLSLKASSSPALSSLDDFFSDYTRAGVNPDFAFSVLSSDSEFGFSPEGADITQEYKDNGSACNTGSGDTADRCWSGLTTTDEQIASRNTSNNPSGTVTTVKFRSEVGTGHIQTSGTYFATTTVTALAL